MAFDLIYKMISSALLRVHTAYIARVAFADGDKARVKPLVKYKTSDGEVYEPSMVTAVVPPNIKMRETEINYRDTLGENSKMVVLSNTQIAKLGTVTITTEAER